MLKALGGAGGGAGSVNFSAGTASGNIGSVVFSNSNGVSFGLNGSTLTASVAAGAAAINFSAGTTSSNIGSVVFSNSNGLSFGLNASTITGNFSTLVFSNSNNVSFGTNASTLTASYALAVSAAGGTSNALSGLTFSNVNGVSFGLSTGAGVGTLSASVAAQTNQSGGIYVLNNTTGASSTSTYDARSLSVTLGGALSGGWTNGSFEVSAPATSSLVGVNGISISTNGSTISISNLASTAPVTRFIWPQAQLTALSAPGNASATFVYFAPQVGITATRVDALVSWAGASSATTNTCAFAISAYAVIYTRNASTLSSLSSGSTQTTYSYASNTGGQTQLITGAMRPISVPVNINMSAGEYFVGFNIVTATSSVGLSTTNLAQSISMMGGIAIQTAAVYAEFTNVTTASSGLYFGMGVYSAATTGLSAAYSISGINQTGSSLSQANIALVFRNA